MACVEPGLPWSAGKKAISLERQVRIAAGSLVLLGIGGWWRSFIRPSSACRPSSGPGWSSPGSPTPAGWA